MTLAGNRSEVWRSPAVLGSESKISEAAEAANIPLVEHL